MVRFYCPNCWIDMAVDLKICPACHANIENIDSSRNLIDKLINALYHPDNSVVMRAIWILGQHREQKAVEPLIQLARKTDDIYKLRAIVLSLGSIGGHQAIRFLWTMKNHQAKIVREAIEESIG